METSSSLISLLVILSGLLVQTCYAVKIVIPPGKTECVSQSLTGEHFEVPGGPRIDGRVLVGGNSQYYVPFITIRVTSSTGEQLWQQQHVYSEAHFNVAARGPGSYQACFFNPWESRTDAVVDLVYFTLAHLRRPMGGGGVTIPKGTSEDRAKELAHKEHMDEVQRTILGMSEFISVVGGSQKYLHRKLERHQQTMASNSRRVRWYAVLEVGVLLVVTGVQIYTIRKFFESGRIKITV
mmetsp:Transcript_13916/g.30054  ORF Transcript_13916/g.30054 Transcript_13916/m.30054 type:complete len:238 (+) Transcript_13916:97-810(+)